MVCKARWEKLWPFGEFNKNPPSHNFTTKTEDMFRQRRTFGHPNCISCWGHRMNFGSRFILVSHTHYFMDTEPLLSLHLQHFLLFPFLAALAEHKQLGRNFQIQLDFAHCGVICSALFPFSKLPVPMTEKLCDYRVQSVYKHSNSQTRKFKGSWQSWVRGEVIWAEVTWSFCFNGEQ